jgi:amidase
MQRRSTSEVSMGELCDLSAIALRWLIGAKQISPVELLASCRARIERVNGALNAFVATCWDRAEAEARAAEQAVMAGAPLGPLHGLPVGIKDLALTEGLRTTFGSPQFSEFVPEADERQVGVIREAGGIVVGKTNTPEFGAGANTVNPVYGATGNPFDPEKTCAGSSGGSAVALATGMVPLATGSDMGGSLRNPAAYCGVVGFRPSPGAVPHELRLLGWSPLSVQGAMGRTVADTALLHGVMAATDTRDPLSAAVIATASNDEVDLGNLRVATSEDLGFAPVDDGIRQTFRAAVAGFEGVFARVDRRDPPLDDSAHEVFEVTRALAFVAAHGGTYRERPEVLGPNIRANVEQGLAMSLEDVARAMRRHTELYRAFVDFMAGYDALICPAMAVPPFPHRELYVAEINGKKLRTYFHWLALPYGLTLTASPVACIPCGRDQTAMPFGIQVCGRRFGDRRTLAIADALERHLQTIPELARPLPDLESLSARAASGRSAEHEGRDLVGRDGAARKGEAAPLRDLARGVEEGAQRHP